MYEQNLTHTIIIAKIKVFFFLKKGYDYKEIESKSDKSEEDEMSPFKDCSDVEYPVDEEALTTRRSLNIKIMDDYVEQQKKNIFHTRCHLSNNIYSITIDSWSCV
jgi:hypothetical protein